jgi:hypothetical protein
MNNIKMDNSTNNNKFEPIDLCTDIVVCEPDLKNTNKSEPDLKNTNKSEPDLKNTNKSENIIDFETYDPYVEFISNDKKVSIFVDTMCMQSLPPVHGYKIVKNKINNSDGDGNSDRDNSNNQNDDTFEKPEYHTTSASDVISVLISYNAYPKNTEMTNSQKNVINHLRNCWTDDDEAENNFYIYGTSYNERKNCCGYGLRNNTIFGKITWVLDDTCFGGRQGGSYCADNDISCKYSVINPIKYFINKVANMMNSRFVVFRHVY